MIGETLSHYVIVEIIGAGRMGEVYRAHDGPPAREVAIKVLPLAVAVGPAVGVSARCAVTSPARRRSSVTQEPSASCANLPRSEIRPLESTLTSGGAKGSPYPFSHIPSAPTHAGSL